MRRQEMEALKSSEGKLEVQRKANGLEDNESCGCLDVSEAF